MIRKKVKVKKGGEIAKKRKVSIMKCDLYTFFNHRSHEEAHKEDRSPMHHPFDNGRFCCSECKCSYLFL